jgi:hypothetical protein
MHSEGVARGHVMHDPAWPRPASAAHGARRHDAGAREAAALRRLTGAGTADGSTASKGEASVGTAAARVRWSGWRRRARGGTLSGGERRGRGGCRDARHAVSIAALSHGVVAARGGHAAAARYCAGPLVSDF